MVSRLKRTTLSNRQERALEKTLQNLRVQRRNRFRVLACINEEESSYITVRFAARLAPGERVLDVGCGRGLLLVGAAKRLTTGAAVGIDIWDHTLLAGNRPAATLANAVAEGVAERITLREGDARHLPFADASFDVVLSSLMLHHMTPNGRAEALREMVRVLRPGGRVVVKDLVASTEAQTPDREKAAFRLPPGFEAQLIVCEPDINKPMNLAFDASSRLWLTDSLEYPFPAQGRKPRDTVKILVDRDQNQTAPLRPGMSATVTVFMK